MLTVACVFRTFTHVAFGSAYDDTWVRKLRDGVARHLTVPHRFVCLSNQMIVGVETIPLRNNWHGWWSKIEMFRPGQFDGPVLSLDLDVMVTGNIDAFAGPFPNMMMLADTMPGMKNSTCMWWDGTDPVYEMIYHTFAADPIGRAKYHHLFNYNSMGDQGLIADTMAANNRQIDMWQDVLGPDQFKHFSSNSAVNKTLIDNPLPEEAKLVYCLGRPKFDTFTHLPMVQQHWREENGNSGLNLTF